MKTSTEALRGEVLAAIDEAADELWERALDIHAHPEVAFQEHRSADRLSEALRRWGYAVERPVAAPGTAFLA